MEEKQPIPIDDSMPEGLKKALTYLNEKNISLDDKIEVNFESEPVEDEDEDFNGVVSDDDVDDTDVDEEDEIVEDDVDISDLNDIF